LAAGVLTSQQNLGYLSGHKEEKLRDRRSAAGSRRKRNIAKGDMFKPSVAATVQGSPDMGRTCGNRNPDRDARPRDSRAH
jgi:hypothetical protein